MKAAINGTLNLSVRDGWWLEGFNGKNGWAFGSSDGNHDQDAADKADAKAFYELMEKEVVPAYYDQDEDGVSERWMKMMEEAVASTLVAFSSHRMVADYASLAYFPMGTRSS
jgi:starch phosphorylase